MARHAGFAVAASITEQMVNDVLATYVRQELGPYLFPVPSTVTALGKTLSFVGIIEMAPPSVELHANPNNTVRVHFSFQSDLRTQVGLQPMLQWKVQWTGSVDVGLITTIVNNQLVVGINNKLVVFQPLVVKELKGRLLPSVVLAALQSSALANAASAFVQSLPRLPLSPPLIRTQIDKVQPGDFKDSGFSVFEWFQLHLSASRVVAKPLEQAITVGVDFSGFSSGDPNQLIDLTKFGGGGSCYVYTISDKTDPTSEPILSRVSEPAGGSIALAVNINFISAIGAVVSSQIGGTPITKNVSIGSIGLGYSTFQKLLRGEEDALALNFQAWVKGPGIQAPIVTEVTGKFYIQPFLRTYDGPTNFLKPDQWSFYVPPAEIDLPWWVDAAVFVLSLVYAVEMPLVIPLIAIDTISIIEGEIPSLLQNIEVQAAQGISSAANSVSFPPPWSQPLPGLSKPNWDGHIKYVSVTPESLDLAIDTWIAWSERGEEPVAQIGIRVYPPYSLAAYPVMDTDDVPLGIKLRDDWTRALAGRNLALVWEIRRNDTGAVVMTATTPYFVVSEGTFSNGPLFAHHTSELYAVENFTVRCTGTLTLGSQVGQVFSVQDTLTIDDLIDRHHKYIHWGPYDVHFNNTGTDGKWWTHRRYSRIHRTAVAARCAMLQKVSRNPKKHKLFKYFDSLPGDWANLDEHRKPLCEYCFFGGPDKHTLLPTEDWFAKEDKI